MPDFDLLFLGALVLAIVVPVIALWGKGEKAFLAKKREFEAQGYVLSYAAEPRRGTVTQIWGRFAAPVPWYLHFSNRDLIASAAGRLGVADIPVGHARFDAEFVVRSNKPEWTRALLTAERCESLLTYGSVQFLTSSVGNQFDPDYWPKDPKRSQRDLWMLRVQGRVEHPAVDRYIALARELAATVDTRCRGAAVTSDELEVPFLEGK